ncbi:MAG: glycosyltransferase [Sphingobacteriales bacterium JAD_PAG50586_3]|nr:MAG: glycosyltransferase [Sphingobacteriales bacterium JAD_PAG50586_3]
MPKVLRIINRFNIGGPTYNAAYLSAYLPPEYETMLLAGSLDEGEESSLHVLDELGLKPVFIKEMKREISPIEDMAAYRKIKEIIREFKPDIVHTHASKAGTLGRLAAASCGVKVIVHTFHGHVFHSYFGKTKTEFYKNIERYLAKKSSRIIAISERQKEELTIEHKICDPAKIAVVPLGFDLDRFQQNTTEKRTAFRSYYNVADDEIAIGIIGRLVPVKGHALFLEALKYLLDNTNKKVRAFIIGDGEDRAVVEAKATELGITFTTEHKPAHKATLTFTSWIKDIDGALAGLDIVALTSLNEGTPVSLIEAQAANKPIVTTNVGGIANVVLKNETAFLIENRSVVDFGTKLKALVEDDDLRHKMGEKGWAHVKDTFHYTRLVTDINALYTQLLNA